MRLDIGAMGRPGATDKFKARIILFDRMRKCAPDKMTSLADEVFPVFHDAVTACGKPFATWVRLVTLASTNSDLIPTVEAIRWWAVDCYLYEGWVLDTIVSSFSRWIEYPEERERRIFIPFHRSEYEYADIIYVLEQFQERCETPRKLTNIRFPLPEFNSITDGLPEYVKLVKDLAGDMAQRYGEEVIRQHQQSNWKLTKVIHNYMHFDWFVSWQVLGLLQREIADKYNLKKTLTEDAISKGIREVAKMVGITPRPGSRGPKAE